jgi:phosphotransferase system HPr-like phosphotransfer protein
MEKIFVNLSSAQEVKMFVNVVEKYPFDVDLVSGRYVINAKSIMGIFSLDLSQPIELVALCDDKAVMEQFIADIKAFLA